MYAPPPKKKKHMAPGKQFHERPMPNDSLRPFRTVVFRVQTWETSLWNRTRWRFSSRGGLSTFSTPACQRELMLWSAWNGLITWCYCGTVTGGTYRSHDGLTLHSVRPGTSGFPSSWQIMLSKSHRSGLTMLTTQGSRPRPFSRECKFEFHVRWCKCPGSRVFFWVPLWHWHSAKY